MSRILYLGLEPPDDIEVIHCPIIEVIPRLPSDPAIVAALSDLPLYTHLIFTSKVGVRAFFALVENQSVEGKQVIAVGKRTAARIEEYGVAVDHVAGYETAEGVVELLQGLNLKGAYCFWPHSALSRGVIPTFFEEEGVWFRECVLYDTVPRKGVELPDLATIDKIVFTSPSTVGAFRKIVGELPRDKRLVGIGPITERALEGG